MKELSIEEKAKRYEEVLHKAQKWYNANTNEGYRGIFEDIFSELKESGDEKIRKWLISYFKEVCDNVSEKEKKGVIAWLEKQGDKDKEILVLKDQIESLQAAIKALKEAHKIELKKQGEQKSFDTDTIKKKAYQIAWEISKHYDPNACKQEWCEMAVREGTNYVLEQIEKVIKADRILGHPFPSLEMRYNQIINIIEQLKK